MRCTLCNVDYHDTQMQVHMSWKKHQTILFDNYRKFIFPMLVIPRKKRTVRSTSPLKVLSQREVKMLREYWSVTGISLPIEVSNGIKVKEGGAKTLGAAQMFLKESTVIVSGHRTVAIYLHRFLDAHMCSELFDIALEIYNSGPSCKRTSERTIDGVQGKMVMGGYKTRGVIEKFSRSEQFHSLCEIVADSIAAKLSPVFPSWFNTFEDFSNPIGDFGRIGASPFSTMSVTLDFFNYNHCDIGDMGYGIFAWFSKGAYEIIEFFLFFFALLYSYFFHFSGFHI
jgi:hypothetical protein